MSSVELKNMNMTVDDFHNAVKRYITNCNQCKHINLTEREQTNKKENHICTLFNKRCLHQGYHPSIIPCIECNSDNFEQK